MRRNITRTGVVRKLRQQRYVIKQWVDRLPAVPAFIVGNGPSLNNCDLSLIEDFFSVGINRCFLKGNFDPTILFWQDPSLWTSEYHKIHNLKAIKVCRDIADPRRIYYNFMLKGGDFKFDKQCHILWGRGNSLALAVQMCEAMGCNPIILIGADCKHGEDGRTDFYGNNPYHPPTMLQNCKRGLKFIKEQSPVQIISCSDNEYWERKELIDTINEIDPVHKIGRQGYVQQLLATST